MSKNPAGGVVVLLFWLGAQATNAAGFQFSTTTVAGPAGFDIVRLFAKLTPDPNSGQPFSGATGIQAINATATSTGIFKFRFVDQNGDGIDDWDPTGAWSATDANGRFNNLTSAGSFIRPGFPTSGVMTLQSTTPSPIILTPVDLPIYSQLKSFQVAAFIQGGVDSTAVSDSSGALIIKAVVPSGSTVEFVGTVQADVGPVTPFDVTTPEPAGLLLGGLAIVLFAHRSRRIGLNPSPPFNRTQRWLSDGGNPRRIPIIIVIDYVRVI